MITAHAFYKSASYLCVFQQSNHPAGLTPRRTLGMTSCGGWAAQSSDRKTVRTKGLKKNNLISSKNHPKIIQKSSKNHPKIVQKSSKNHPKIIQKSSKNHPKSSKIYIVTFASPKGFPWCFCFTSLHLPNSVRTLPRQAPHNKQVQACGRPPGKGGSVCNHSLILIGFNFNQNPDVHS